MVFRSVCVSFVAYRCKWAKNAKKKHERWRHQSLSQLRKKQIVEPALHHVVSLAKSALSVPVRPTLVLVPGMVVHVKLRIYVIFCFDIRNM